MNRLASYNGGEVSFYFRSGANSLNKTERERETIISRTFLRSHNNPALSHRNVSISGTCLCVHGNSRPCFVITELEKHLFPLINGKGTAKYELFGLHGLRLLSGRSVLGIKRLFNARITVRHGDPSSTKRRVM